MRVEVQRNESSESIIYDYVENAYTKGLLYCIMFVKDGIRVIHKYPIASLFRVVEDYSKIK